MQPTLTKRPASEGTESVAVTGSFDDWSISKGVLKKDANGDFSGEVLLDEPQRIVFKFVINNTQWITSPKYNIEHDVHGNANNFLDPEDLEEVKPELNEALSETPAEAPSVADFEQKELSEEPLSDADHLVDVPTSQSSYAALSLPSDGYEDLGDEDVEDFPAENSEELTEKDVFEMTNQASKRDHALWDPPLASEPRHRNAPIDIETPRSSGNLAAHHPSSYKSGFTDSGDTTPTNSLRSSGIFGSKQHTVQTRDDSEVSTLGHHSRSSSYIAKSQQGSKAQDPLVVNPEKEKLSSPQPEKKKGDRLVSRFKGLFF